MTVVKIVRTSVVATLVSLGLVVGAMTSWAGGSVAKAPKLVVAPSAGLKNGTVVKVRGYGFKAHDHVYIVECLATAKGQAGCDTLSATAAVVDAHGVLSVTKFRVITGVIGNGACGTKTANLKSCAISVGNITGGDSAVARISFVAPKKG